MKFVDSQLASQYKQLEATHLNSSSPEEYYKTVSFTFNLLT